MSEPVSHPRGSVAGAYFDAVYRDFSDPWNYRGPYEQEKLEDLLAALPSCRYASGLEIGCGEGVTTAALAERCDRITAVDCSEVALERARWRYRHLRQVRFLHMTVPADLIGSASYDLAVLAEVGYYLTLRDLSLAADRLAEALLDGGTLALLHWLGSSPEHRTTGTQVHETFVRHYSFSVISSRQVERHGLQYAISFMRRTGRGGL